VLETLTWHSQHVPLCPHYRARHAGEYARNQTVTARWVHPGAGPRRRAIIYVHGWLEPGPWVEEAVLLPKLYDTLAADVLHVQLPFHGARNPKSALFHGEFFWSADLVRSVEAVRQSCIDARTLLAWLRAQGYTEVGVTGISLGGSITMVLACLAPTPDYIVPIVSHLQLAEAVEEAPILWRMKADLESFGVDKARRQEIFRRLGLGSLKPILPPERQLWIMARDDVYIAAPLVETRCGSSPPPPRGPSPPSATSSASCVCEVCGRTVGECTSRARCPTRRARVCGRGWRCGSWSRWPPSTRTTGRRSTRGHAPSTGRPG
jgi:pimeloyl-ACP methyl ester carboxylesterase